MSPSFLIRASLTLLIAAAGCRTERSLTEQRRPVPLATAADIANFTLVAPNLGDLPADGRCDTLARQVDQLSSVKGQLVSFGSTAAKRRITIGVDDAQRIVYYDDVHQGPIAEWVLIDRRYDDGTAVSMRPDAQPRRVHGHADDFLMVRGLGSPTQVARRVINACSAMLILPK